MRCWRSSTGAWTRCSMKRPIDTTPDVHARMIDAYRQMSPDRKWRNLGEDWVTVRLLHHAGFRQRHPTATPAAARADWLRQSLGGPPPFPLPDTDMTLMPFSPVLRTVLRVFDR